MRATVARLQPALLKLAVEVVGHDPFDNLERGTRFVQPAIYCAGVAGWSQFSHLRPNYFAGHSLGEITALAAAGSITAEQGLAVVALRGRLMEEAGRRGPRGSMMALLGADHDAAAAIADRAGVAVANDNAPGQVVLAGDLGQLRCAAEEGRQEGFRVIELQVTEAFHTPAMAPAVQEFEAELARIEFRTPRVPVFSGVTAAPFDDIRHRLVQSLTSPVRWRETIVGLCSRGVRTYVDVGPGRVLWGLIRRIQPEAEALNAHEKASPPAVHELTCGGAPGIPQGAAGSLDRSRSGLQRSSDARA